MYIHNSHDFNFLDREEERTSYFMCAQLAQKYLRQITQTCDLVKYIIWYS